MIEFKTITLCDRKWVDELVMKENSVNADYNFGNMYIWDKHYRQLISRFGDRMFTKLRFEGRPSFVFPIGSGPVKPAIDALREYADIRKIPFTLRGVTQEHREILEAEYPGRFAFQELEGGADYIYPAEKLSSYSGKALHGKKNHCNRFEAEHDWEFRPITRELIPACLDMLDIWTEDNLKRLDPSVCYEHDAIIRAFAAYERLGLEGGALISGDRLLGFSMGELAGPETFDVHFEKAAIEVNGAYPMVCREMCRMAMRNHPGLKYINREDDMGLESLRRSKLSYKPEFLLKKYIARWIYD